MYCPGSVSNPFALFIAIESKKSKLTAFNYRTLNSHDINVAILSICGGIAGTIEQCQGQPTTTTGASGDAQLNLQVETEGTNIIITKGRWEGCMRAARAVCGDSPFSSTCIGGANDNRNNVLFQLVQQ